MAEKSGRVNFLTNLKSALVVPSFCVLYSRRNTCTNPMDLYFVFCVCILFLPLFWWCFVSIVITCTIPMDASLNREESPWQNCPNEKKWKIKTSNYLFFYKISFEDNNSKSPQVGCNLLVNLKTYWAKIEQPVWLPDLTVFWLSGLIDLLSKYRYFQDTT